MRREVRTQAARNPPAGWVGKRTSFIMSSRVPFRWRVRSVKSGRTTCPSGSDRDSAPVCMRSRLRFRNRQQCKSAESKGRNSTVNPSAEHKSERRIGSRDRNPPGKKGGPKPHLDGHGALRRAMQRLVHLTDRPPPQHHPQLKFGGLHEHTALRQPHATSVSSSPWFPCPSHRTVHRTAKDRHCDTVDH